MLIENLLFPLRIVETSISPEITSKKIEFSDENQKKLVSLRFNETNNSIYLYLGLKQSLMM